MLAIAPESALTIAADPLSKVVPELVTLLASEILAIATFVESRGSS